jgi:hypothetical protein
VTHSHQSDCVFYCGRFDQLLLPTHMDCEEALRRVSSSEAVAAAAAVTAAAGAVLIR